MKRSIALSAVVALTFVALAAIAVVPDLFAQTAPAAVAPAAAECGPLVGTLPVADDIRATPDMARVSEADARATALRAVPGATLVDIDLDDEDGFLVYEVDLIAGIVETEVTIDAGSGAVLCTDLD